MVRKRGKRITNFERQVYRATKKIPLGRVSTYGDVAREIGCPKAARAVGNALNKNPYAPAVPCHRVVKNNGRIGGFASGIKTKTKLLKREGVATYIDRIVEFKKIKYTFMPER